MIRIELAEDRFGLGSEPIYWIVSCPCGWSDETGWLSEAEWLAHDHIDECPSY